MKKITIVIMLSFIVLGTLNESINADISKIGQSGDDFRPEIVFLYPYDLKNGSSYSVGENIYFTVVGDLSRLDNEDGSYFFKFKWDIGEQEWGYPDSLRNVGIFGFQSPVFLIKSTDYINEQVTDYEYNQWHNLSISLYYWIYGEHDWSNTIYYHYSFFADSNYKAQDIGINPINYQNNSVIEYSGSAETIEIWFNTSGWKFWNLDYSVSSSFVPEYGILDFECKWDNFSWFSLSNLHPSKYNYDTWKVKLWKDYSELFEPNNTHTLYIRLANETDTYETNFIYQFKKTHEFHVNLNLDFGDLDIPQFFEGSEPLINVGQSNSTIINWNLGQNNITIPYSTFYQKLDLPLFNFSQKGYHYLSIFTTIEHESEIFTLPEMRKPYKVVVPKLNIRVDAPIFSKHYSGYIPLIWSIDIGDSGWWNYSQYKFDIKYETDISVIKTVQTGYRLIGMRVYHGYGVDPLFYYASVYTYGRYHPPALLAYLFPLQEVVFNQSGVNPSTIRFIITETATNTTINVTMQLTINTTTTTSTAIPSTTNTTTTTKPATTTTTEDESSTTPPPDITPGFSLIPALSMIAIILVIKRSRKSQKMS